MKNDIYRSIEIHVSRNNIADAVQLLNLTIVKKNSKYQNQVLKMKADLNFYNKKILGGTYSNEELHIMRSNIINSIFIIVDKFKNEESSNIINIENLNLKSCEKVEFHKLIFLEKDKFQYKAIREINNQKRYIYLIAVLMILIILLASFLLSQTYSFNKKNNNLLSLSINTMNSIQKDAIELRSMLDKLDDYHNEGGNRYSQIEGIYYEVIHDSLNLIAIGKIYYDKKLHFDGFLYKISPLVQKGTWESKGVYFDGDVLGYNYKGYKIGTDGKKNLINNSANFKGTGRICFTGAKGAKGNEYQGRWNEGFGEYYSKENINKSFDLYRITDEILHKFDMDTLIFEQAEIKNFIKNAGEELIKLRNKKF